jgi:hypothetical protein
LAFGEQPVDVRKGAIAVLKYFLTWNPGRLRRARITHDGAPDRRQHRQAAGAIEAAAGLGAALVSQAPL